MPGRAKRWVVLTWAVLAVAGAGATMSLRSAAEPETVRHEPGPVGPETEWPPDSAVETGDVTHCPPSPTPDTAWDGIWGVIRDGIWDEGRGAGRGAGRDGIWDQAGAAGRGKVEDLLVACVVKE
jgi:hypothetical protein